MNDSFIFYRGFYEALEGLSAEEFRDCVKALCEYALNGDEHPESATAKMYLSLTKPNIDANFRKREAGRKGGEARVRNAASKSKQEQAPRKDPPTNVNVNVDVNGNEDVKKSKRFVPPSISEVAAYCRERKNMVDPEQFVSFYESVGWKVGSKPMKDWRAAVRTWERRRKSGANIKPNSFNDFSERNYYSAEDFAALEQH